MAALYRSDDDDFDALQLSCRVHFGSHAMSDQGLGSNPTLSATFAVTALGDGHALSGLATPDVAMTIVRMLAVCVRCGKQPAVPAAAIDAAKEWCDVSVDCCSTCFAQLAVELHDGAIDSHGLDCTDTSEKADESTMTLSHPARRPHDAVHMTRSLAQRGAVRLLRIGTHGCQRVLDVDRGVAAVAYSPDGTTLVTGSYSNIDRTVPLWDALSGGCGRVLKGHTRDVWAVAYSPDGATIATGSDDEAVRVWDAASGECRRVLEGHTHYVVAVAYSPDGATIASGSRDCTARVWDTVSGECRRVLRGHTRGVRAVAYSPDGATIVTGSWDSTVRMWDAALGELRRVLEGHTSSVMAVAYSPDGMTIATGSDDNTVRLWEAASGECRCVLQGHKRRVNAVAYSPDGATIATGSDDLTVRVWDVQQIATSAHVLDAAEVALHRGTAEPCRKGHRDEHATDHEPA